jgi:hypothetical protein
MLERESVNQSAKQSDWRRNVSGRRKNQTNQENNFRRGQNPSRQFSPLAVVSLKCFRSQKKFIA